MYSTQVLSFKSILQYSLRHYGIILKKLLPIIVLMVIVKDIPNFLSFLKGMSGWIMDGVALILMIYLLQCVIFIVHRVINEQSCEIKEAFSAALKSSPRVYIACLIYVLIVVALFFIDFVLGKLAIYLGISSKTAYGLGLVLVVSFPSLILFVLFFYAIPLLVVTQDQLLSAFYTSYYIVGKEYWIETFLFYLVGFVVIFVLSFNTSHGHWLQKYYLNMPFDFVVFCIVLPFYVSILLLTLNNLRIKKNIEKLGASHIEKV